MTPDLVTAVRRRGWNLYDSTRVTEIGPEQVIKAGPVETLQVGRSYVLLPEAENPSDPDKVYASLEGVAVALRRETPTIEIWGSRLPLTGFRILPDVVKINTPDGETLVSQAEAIAAAGTLFNVKSGRYD